MCLDATTGLIAITGNCPVSRGRGHRASLYQARGSSSSHERFGTTRIHTRSSSERRHVTFSTFCSDLELPRTSSPATGLHRIHHLASTRMRPPAEVPPIREFLQPLHYRCAFGYERPEDALGRRQSCQGVWMALSCREGLHS